MVIKEFSLIKDGFYGGFLGSEKQPYKPLSFFGGEIIIEQVNDAIHISVDESTKTNLELTIKEIMRGFSNINIEDLMTQTDSRYRITTPQQIDFLNQDQLFSVQKVVDGYTFVFMPTV